MQQIKGALLLSLPCVAAAAAAAMDVIRLSSWRLMLEGERKEIQSNRVESEERLAWLELCVIWMDSRISGAIYSASAPARMGRDMVGRNGTGHRNIAMLIRQQQAMAHQLPIAHGPWASGLDWTRGRQQRASPSTCRLL